MPAPAAPFDLDALLRGAKDTLRRADALSASVDSPRTTAPAMPVAGGQANADGSLWGQIKRVAHYSPLPEDIGSQFSNDVDPTDVRDSKAARGEYGPLDTLKSFLAGAGGGFFDELRNTATPAGLATLVSGESPAARVAQTAGGALFAGEGAETLADDHSTGFAKAQGVGNVAMGLAGVLSGMGPRGPHAGGRPGAVDPQFGPSPNAPEVGDMRLPQNEGPIPVSAAPAGAKPERWAPNVGRGMPDLGAPGAEADHILPPLDRYMPNTSPAPSATFAYHQPDFEGGSIPIYNVEGGPNHGSSLSAESLHDLGIPVPETPPFESAAAPTESAAPISSAKPRLSAPDVAAMLSGRDKFAAANPDASLPPGAQDNLDRMGVEYTRTQRELKTLLGMPDADPTEIGRMQQGARELGSRLRSTAKGYTTPPDAPMPAAVPPTPPAAPSSLAEMLQASIDAQDADRAARVSSNPPPARDGHFRLPEARVPDPVFEKIRADKGIPPTPDERATRDVSAAGGTSAPEPALSDAFTREFNPTPDVTDSARSFFGDETGSADPALLASMLRIPAGAAAGAYFDPENRTRGAVLGGGLAGATMIPGVGKNLERARYFSMLTGPAQLKNIVGDLGVVGHAAAERGLTHGPSEGLNVLREFLSPETAKDYGSILTGKNVPLERLDQPSSTSDRGITGLPFRLMGAADEATKNALTRAGIDDAAHRTFTADPQTELGQATMQWQRKGGSLARLIMPFAKTAINQAEGGITPIADVLRGKRDPQTLAKVALLGASGAAGAAYGSTDFAKAHPKVSPFAAIMSGPGALEFAVAQQFAKARAENKSAPQALQQAGGALQQQMPMPSEWAFSPAAILASLIPTGLRSVNLDDVERDTSGSLFGPAIARVPGLSQTLPAKGGTARPRRKFLQ